MPSETATRHAERQPEEVMARLDTLEAMVRQLTAIINARIPLFFPASTPIGYYLLHARNQEKIALLLAEVEQRHLGPREWPVPPWQHLVGRDHPWRKQLYVKGRNMTVRQLVGTVKANQLTPEEAASDLDLPVDAIHEALAYAEKNEELLKIETEIEELFLKRGKARGTAAVPR